MVSGTDIPDYLGVSSRLYTRQPGVYRAVREVELLPGFESFTGTDEFTIETAPTTTNGQYVLNTDYAGGQGSYESYGYYRYGFNGQEKSDEIKGSGNSYTAEFWEYDPRVGRRWNVDPVDFHFQSVYAVFNNNPIFYIDPDGLYATKERAEKMRQRAIDGGKNVGNVVYRKKQKDYVFTTLNVKTVDGETVADFTVHSKTRYFGGFFQRAGNFISDVNPFESAEAYVGILAKTEVEVASNVNVNLGDKALLKKGVDFKTVIPFGGGQAKMGIGDGQVSGDVTLITGEQSYINGKVGNVDYRIMPLNNKGIGGDYDPGVRALYTFMRKPIIVPVSDVPVPVGEWKLQGDFQTHSSRTTLGVRGVAETLSIPSFEKGKSGIKLELNAGIRLVLKVPDLFQ